MNISISQQGQMCVCVCTCMPVCICVSLNVSGKLDMVVHVYNPWICEVEDWDSRSSSDT